MKHALSQREIIKRLRADKPFLSQEFGVVSIGLFGSYAKGEQDMDSDIDLVVELKEPSFGLLAGLLIYLEENFDRKIELVRKGRKINRRFTSLIEKDVIYA